MERKIVSCGLRRRDNQQPQNNRDNQLQLGFTLTELLVVLTIVTLLSAILFSAFTVVRNRALASACASNLHQFGKALALYQQDYDDGLPMSVTRSAACAATIHEVIAPYLSGELLCSSESKPDNVKELVVLRRQTPCADNDYHTAYSTNDSVISDGLRGFLPRKIQEFPQPSLTMVAYESRVSASGLKLFQGRHHGFLNAVFLDGHTKALPTRKIGSTSSYKGDVLPVFAVETDIGGCKNQTSCQNLPPEPVG